MQTRFLVTWKMDVYAESAEQAAEAAWETMQEAGSQACYFEVFDQDGNKTNVDLLEDGEC